MSKFLDLIEEEAEKHGFKLKWLTPSGTILFTLKVKGLITEEELKDLISLQRD